MIAVLSPAKSLDFETPSKYDIQTKPVFEEESNYLAKKLERLSKNKLSKLMSLSDNLTDLNYQRYKNWNHEDTNEGKKQAIYAFNGDTYTGFDVEQLNKADIEYAQNHVRILSGIYGILKPMDLIQPYRLEMGTKLEITKTKTDLYTYWNKSITEQLNKDIEGYTSKAIVNLASNEYFKAVKPKQLKGEIIDITFKDEKNGKLKVISFFAKKARGAMARFIVTSRAKTIEDLKIFNDYDYLFSEQLSTKEELVFTR